MTAPSARVTIWASISEKEPCAQTRNKYNLVGTTGQLSLFPLPSLPHTLFLQLNTYTTIMFFDMAVHNLTAYFACCLLVTCITFLPFRVFFYESHEYKLSIKSKSNQLTFKLELNAISYNRQ